MQHPGNWEASNADGNATLQTPHYHTCGDQSACDIMEFRSFNIDE